MLRRGTETEYILNNNIIIRWVAFEIIEALEFHGRLTPALNSSWSAAFGPLKPLRIMSKSDENYYYYYAKYIYIAKFRPRSLKNE